MSVQGKVVIITGSAGGIGRYIAKTFGEEHAKVVVADMKPLDTVAAELNAMDVEHLAIPTDVRDESSVRRLMATTADKFGRIDVLINNAAIVTHFQWGNVQRWPRVKDMDKDFWDKVIDTNLGGVWRCSKHVIPYMETQHGGHIISTLGGSTPESIGSLAYVVSKDAIRTFTKFLAGEEKEHDICCLSIAPGATIATEEAPEEARARMPGVEVVGNRYVLAAQAPMDLSGQMVNVEEGLLVGRG